MFWCLAYNLFMRGAFLVFSFLEAGRIVEGVSTRKEIGRL